jgi:hypothetical protein
MDAFYELAVVPPHATMCRALGVPDDDAGLIYRHFLTCTDALGHGVGEMILKKQLSLSIIYLNGVRNI